MNFIERKKNGMTYAQWTGSAPFDWNLFLKRAIAGKLARSEESIARYMAINWPTCACGNLCSKLPRDTRGKPRDQRLADLGGLFYVLISSARWEEAKVTLAEIEERSHQLLSLAEAPGAEGQETEE